MKLKDWLDERDITVPQFRWVFVRAGTDPKHAQVIAAALEKWAGTPDYAKYLEQEWADPKSFVSMAKARSRFEATLEALRREARTGGMKTADK